MDVEFSDSLTIPFTDGTTGPLILDGEGTELSVELMASSREPIAANGLKWYAGIGIARLEVEADFSTTGGVNVTGIDGDDSDTEAVGSLGVFLPVSFGEAYAGVEHVDELRYGAGLRFYL